VIPSANATPRSLLGDSRAFQVTRIKLECCRNERFVKARRVNPTNLLTELRGAVSSRPLPYAGRAATLQLENPGQEVNQCPISFLTHSGYLKSSQTR
jgi:hypothetical protein